MYTRLRFWFGGEDLVPNIIISINVVIWLLSVTVGGLNWLTPSPAQLAQWGGNSAAVTFTGQSWRLFTSIFIHAGILHLAMNMFVLSSVGFLLVRQVGSWTFLFLYLCGGVLASAASAWWQAQFVMAAYSDPLGWQQTIFRFTVSVGASGAILAVCGALVAIIVRMRFFGNRAYGFDRTMQNALLRVVAINIAIGFFIRAIDQSAHVGGVVAGFLIGMVLPLVFSWPSKLQKTVRIGLACLLTATLLGLAFASVDHNLLIQARKTFQMQLLR